MGVVRLVSRLLGVFRRRRAAKAFAAVEATPTVLDPCQWCGRRVVRLSDNSADVPPPENLAQAKSSWKDCVATQRSRWAFCPRTVKGFVSVPVEGTWAQVALERRAALL